MGRPLNLWVDTAPSAGVRAPLPGDLSCDVAIVGGGFTGLWTAYYLLGADPTLRVAVLEAEQVGYGASGRNGGWCSALFPTPLPGMHDAMVATIDEIERVLVAEEIDAHFHRGGTITVARTPAQLARMEPEPGGSVLSEEAARTRLNAHGTLGGTFTPDCARIHPLRLVRGLATALEQRGALIHEGTRALHLSPGAVVTERGVVKADVVVRATEGYTARIDGLRRAIVPVYSLVVGTEPLPPSVWDEVGLADYETFSDHRHLIIYGQRTADDRLVFGGRGAPYHWGSRIRPSYDVDERVFGKLRSTLVDMFPLLSTARFTHAWGGALGIPRDWCASVGLRDGLAWAGGYVGDGVSTTNLAGRTLTDLVLGRTTELTALPWVNHDSALWEPEPLRWLGVNAGLRAMTLADVEERVTNRPSRIGRAMSRFLGGH
jgi:glycine/D-amino acid oxidase-like deaminating enzyme